MATIAEVTERFLAFDLMKEAQIAIGLTEKAMIKAQQDQRKETGKGQKGLPIGPPYRSPVYRELKINEGHGDFVDLNLTGETDAQMFVDVNVEMFTIASSGELFPKLEKKYGPLAYGLDEEYMGKYIEESFFPQLKEQIERVTGLEMT